MGEVRQAKIMGREQRNFKSPWVYVNEWSGFRNVTANSANQDSDKPHGKAFVVDYSRVLPLFLHCILTINGNLSLSVN